MNRLLLTASLLLSCLWGWSQCALLNNNINLTFNASRDCAPVQVDQFIVEYSFSIAQDPGDIEIVFEWNDPANNFDVVSGTDLVVSNGNRTFRATAPLFTYPQGRNECFYPAQAFIRVANVVCTTSIEEQLVRSWDTDNFGQGFVNIEPDNDVTNEFTVCEETAFSVEFSDQSLFNCRDDINLDDPNEVIRHTQFVFGEGYINGSIRSLELDSNNDGIVDVQITDAAGNLVAPSTVGTVTAGHFGPIVPVPFPAENPNNASGTLSADANAANNGTFRVTLYNWNICNEWNSSTTNPNYNDAIVEFVDITYVQEPDPQFVARLGNAGGPAGTTFCINEDIFFDNNSTGATQYFWEFFDDNTGTVLLDTSDEEEPTFQYTTGGVKRIRLTAINPDIDATCEISISQDITISPDAVADFEFTDGMSNIINPDFCQTGTDIFTVGFIDNTGLVLGTELRYEFYNEGNPPTNNSPDSFEPTDGSFILDANIPEFTRDFSNIAFVIVRLVARNTLTGCESFAQDTVFVYDQPNAAFQANEACEGDNTGRTEFSNISPNNDINIQLNGDVIELYQWDFSYDGVTFRPELERTNNNDFEWRLDGNDLPLFSLPAAEPAASAAGTYRVALRTITERGGCESDLFELDVTVNPTPDAVLAYDFTTDVCPGDLIQFTNNSVNDPALGTEYILRVTSPLPSTEDFVFNTTDTLVSFENPLTTILTYEAVLIAETDDLCTTTSSPPLAFNVLPDEDSQFTDANISALNCSPWNSTLEVDINTRNLDPDRYDWTILEEGNPTPVFQAFKLRPGGPLDVTSDFHEQEYGPLENTSNSIRNFSAILEVTKLGVCVSNDTLNFQISPQPSALFEVNVFEDCEEVAFELSALQEGLSNYNWVFNPPPPPGADVPQPDPWDRMISYLRDANAGSDFSVTISLETTNLTGCPSLLEDTTILIDRQRQAITPGISLITNDTVQLPDARIEFINTTTPDNPNFTYLWDFGGQGTSTERDPGSFTFENFGSFAVDLEVTDDFCVEETRQIIVVLPANPVIDFEADTLRGCAPLTVQFTNLSQSAVSGEFLWEFGDGSISNLDNPVHTYFNGGVYDVRLVGRNNTGVFEETTKEAYIEVLDRPFANYIASSRVVFIPDQEVFFRNLSTGATSYLWDFGDGFTSTDFEPSHAYTLEGFYDITLISINDLGCADTLVRDADVEAVTGGETNSPNAFTPDQNGPRDGLQNNNLDVNSVNDIFLPRAEGVVSFRMYVYNKWGQLLFESSDQNIGWDGYYRGRLAPAGVYVYKLELTYSDGRDEIKAGDVTLIR